MSEKVRNIQCRYRVFYDEHETINADIPPNMVVFCLMRGDPAPILVIPTRADPIEGQIRAMLKVVDGKMETVMDRFPYVIGMIDGGWWGFYVETFTGHVDEEIDKVVKLQPKELQDQLKDLAKTEPASPATN